MPKDGVMWIDVEAIVDGYRQGYFLMAEDDESDLAWYNSRERTLIPLDDRFHVPRSLRRYINQNRFSVAIDQDFGAVVEGCANRESTWISDELKEIYWALHKAGWAHSFETWQQGQLQVVFWASASVACLLASLCFIPSQRGLKWRW
jgi:leucyl/phenylalanyl-tRNA---protein transferase